MELRSELPRRKRWSLAEYLRLIDLGAIGAEDRVELLEGEIVEKTAQNLAHVVGARATVAALRTVFGEGFDVNPQLPIPLGESMPEPDVMVLGGTWRDYVLRHPRPEEVSLLVEVADASRLDHDRKQKSRIYATAGIREYWILNLVDRRLEVHRQPQADGTYGEVRHYRETESCGPMGRDMIKVADLLPPAETD